MLLEIMKPQYGLELVPTWSQDSPRWPQIGGWRPTDPKGSYKILRDLGGVLKDSAKSCHHGMLRNFEAPPQAVPPAQESKSSQKCAPHGPTNRRNGPTSRAWTTSILSIGRAIASGKVAGAGHAAVHQAVLAAITNLSSGNGFA